MQNKNKVALIIDADHVSPTKVAPIIAHYHEPAVRRAYGNWCSPQMKRWETTLQQHGIRAMQQFAGNTIAIAADVMELFHSGLYETFIIVTRDSDYTPLVTKLRESGAEVIGIGQPEVPEACRNAFSEFILVENMMADISEEPSGLVDDLIIPDDLLAEDALQPDPSDDDLWDTLEDLELEAAPVAPEDSLWNTLEDLALDAAPAPSEDCPWAGLLQETPAEPADPAISAEVASIMEELFGDCEANSDSDEEGAIQWDDLDSLLTGAAEEESSGESEEIVWDTFDMGCTIISSDDPDMRSLHKLLQVAYDYCKNEEGYASLSATGNFIRELRPDFDYRDYGFKQLRELLEAFPEKYRIVSAPNPSNRALFFCCCA